MNCSALDRILKSALRAASPWGSTPISRFRLFNDLGVDPGTFDRGRRTGQLSESVLKLLIEACPQEERRALEAEWRAEQSARRIRTRDDLRRQPSDLTDEELLKVRPGNRERWVTLYRLVMDGAGRRGVEARAISEVAEQMIESPRLNGNTAASWRNALMLMHGFYASADLGSAENRLAFMTLTSAALRVAALLGHRPLHLRIVRVLQDASRAFPTDLQLARLSYSAQGTFAANYASGSAARLKEALAFHEAEAETIKAIGNDRSLAGCWPYLYRGSRDAYWNRLNILVSVGAIEDSDHSELKKHQEFRQFADQFVPADFRVAANAALSFEVWAYDQRFLAGVALSRPSRNRSLRGADPSEACDAIYKVLYHPRCADLINNLTSAHLHAQLAEAMLCLNADCWTPRADDEYRELKTKSLRLYEVVNEGSVSSHTARRLRRLETLVRRVRR